MSIQPDRPITVPSALMGPGTTAFQDVWQAIVRRKWRILATIVLAVAVGCGYCLYAGPWYTSTAQLLVIKKRLETTPISGPDQPHVVQDDYLSTHMLIIASRRVIAQGIQKGDLQSLSQFQKKDGLKKKFTDWITSSIFGETPGSGGPEDRMADEIVNSLVVSRDAQKPGHNPSNEIINLSYRGKTAADCPRVLNAIIESYQEFLSENYRNTNEEALRLLTEARNGAQNDLEAKEAAYQKFLAENPPLTKSKDGSTVPQERLMNIEARLSALRLREAEVESAVAMLDRALKSGRNPTAIVQRLVALPANRETGTGGLFNGLDKSAAAGGPRASLEEELLQLQLQEGKLLTVRGAKHPEVQALRAQIESVRNLLLSPSTTQDPTGKVAKDPDLGTIKLELLKQELDDLKLEEQALTRLYDQEQKGVSASVLHVIQDETHRKGIERAQVLYDSIFHRLKEISSVKDFGGYTTQIIGAPLRGELAYKKYLLILGLSVFAGLVLGFGWAYWAEMVARSRS
jgi:uncharacterized protein involved in exopolysaccharide biosynthesis